MATRTVDRALAANLQSTISNMGDGPGGAPYPDARELGPTLAGALRTVRYVFTPGTTTDDAGNVIAATDDVEIETGFDPLYVLLHCTDTNEYQITHFYGQTNGIKVLNAGATAQGAYCTFAAGKAVIKAAATTNAVLHTVLVIG